MTENQFEQNSRLPSERALSAELKILRTLLRKALAGLEAEGLIWRHVGRATFIGRAPPKQQATSCLCPATSSTRTFGCSIVNRVRVVCLAVVHAITAEIAMRNHQETVANKLLASMESRYKLTDKEGIKLPWQQDLGARLNNEHFPVNGYVHK